MDWQVILAILIVIVAGFTLLRRAWPSHPDHASPCQGCPSSRCHSAKANSSPSLPITQLEIPNHLRRKDSADF